MGHQHKPLIKSKVLKYRNINVTAKENIKQSLMNINLNYMEDMPVNNAYNEFNLQLQAIFDTHAPLKTIHVKISRGRYG